MMTSDEAAVVGGIVAGYTAFVLFMSLAIAVALIVAHWIMFTKAGEKGWKSLIPIYSDFVLYRLVWNTQQFFIVLGLSFLASVLTSLSGGVAYNAYGDPTIITANPVLLGLGVAMYIAVLVWHVRLQLKTAAAYGKGTGFGVGLIFLPYIFTLILAFGSARYVGPQE